MPFNTDSVEKRELEPFDQFVLDTPNVEGELHIRFGERESVSIEASSRLLARIETQVKGGRLVIKVGGRLSERIVDALTTSLTRERVRYTVTARALTRLDLIGMVDVEASTLEAEQVALRMRGMGGLRIGQVRARHLEVDLSGPCQIDLSGQVDRQEVTVRAMGAYLASGLSSQRASVDVSGPGMAAVRVAESLAVRVSGPGQVQYYGHPRVSSSLSPFGGLVCLGA
jgi:hypothetical protein